jgi:hypothetical protein
MSEAEYTDAPDSLTITLNTAERLACRRKSFTNACVSRDAVPLPMAMARTLCLAIRPASVRTDPARSFLGSNG